MTAGELRHRATLRTRSESVTARGGTTPAPVTFASRLPVFVSPLAGGALMRAMQIDPRSRYSVAMRFLRGLDSRMEFIYHALEGDKVFEILNINDEEERHVWLTLLCREAS